jgi:hypothetical protein
MCAHLGSDESRSGGEAETGGGGRCSAQKRARRGRCSAHKRTRRRRGPQQRPHRGRSAPVHCSHRHTGNPERQNKLHLQSVLRIRVRTGKITGFGSGMNNPAIFPKSLETGFKYVNSLMRIRDGKHSDTGSGTENIRIRDKIQGPQHCLQSTF